MGSAPVGDWLLTPAVPGGTIQSFRGPEATSEDLSRKGCPYARDARSGLPDGQPTEGHLYVEE